MSRQEVWRIRAWPPRLGAGAMSSTMAALAARRSAHGWLTPVEFVGAWLHRQAHQLA